MARGCVHHFGTVWPVPTADPSKQKVWSANPIFRQQPCAILRARHGALGTERSSDAHVRGEVHARNNQLKGMACSAATTAEVCRVSSSWPAARRRAPALVYKVRSTTVSAELRIRWLTPFLPHLACQSPSGSPAKIECRMAHLCRAAAEAIASNMMARLRSGQAGPGENGQHVHVRDRTWLPFHI